MFPSPDTSTRATPSLQWLPWPPLAGALRFPTVFGIIGFYHCSRSVRAPSVNPWGHVPPMVEEEIESSLRFLDNPFGNMPGLGTPATPARPRDSSRCRILPSARLSTSASQRRNDFGADLRGLLPFCLRFDTHQSPGESKDSILTRLLDFSHVALAPTGLR